MDDRQENATWVYTYDQGGNILSKKKYALGVTSGTAIESKTFTYGNAKWKDQLTAVNGKQITYDAIGNPLSDGTWTYIWEKGRQLKRMQSVDTNASFVYNENGLRVQKTVNGVVTKYTLYGKDIMHMTRGSDELHFFYDAEGKPAIVVYNGTPYSYVKNLQGDIVAILDSTGTAVVQYKYDAWGRQISCTFKVGNDDAEALSILNPFRYRGYVYDEETEFYYLRSRYYCPRLCRFINADTYLGDSSKLFHHNILTYCANCPTIYIDEDGFTEFGVQALEMWKQYYPTIANADAHYPVADIVGLLGLVAVGGAYTIDGIVNLYNYCSTLVATATAASAGKKLQDIAEGFGDFKCVEAMEAMKEYLTKKKLHGYVVTIQYPPFPGFVYTNMYDRQISRNGKHVGIEYNGLVYCNVHPSGLPYEVWVNDFEAVGDCVVTKVPI